MIKAKDLRRVGCAPGQYIVFDPTRLLLEMQRRGGEVLRPRRRYFSAQANGP
ncbi:MAG: hypothetical protein ABIS21_04225 [Acidimicrobiales bacterium]